MKEKKKKKGKISAKTLREFAEIRRIANDAVSKAIEENRKHGIPDDKQFSKL